VILVNNQLDAHFFFIHVYFSSLHVSSTHVLIIRRIKCINMASGIRQLCRWLSGMQVWMEFHPNLRTKRSSIQSDINQMSYWYNWFSWWWAHGCSKHVENWNKHIQKKIVRQVGYLQELNRDGRSTKHNILQYYRPAVIYSCFNL
jgi:hypothetical protein